MQTDTEDRQEDNFFRRRILSVVAVALQMCHINLFGSASGKIN